VHGANRLASVSLLEALFFGNAAGKDAAENLTPVSTALKKSTPDWVHPAPAEEFDPVLIQQDMLNIQSTMWNYAGIIRNRKRLERAWRISTTSATGSNSSTSRRRSAVRSSSCAMPCSPPT